VVPVSFVLFDPQTQQPLKLLSLLKSRPQLELDVLLGARELMPVRLVALRLPAPLAAQRRRRARANARRDHTLRLTERYLKLLDWTILLTNVAPAQLTQPSAHLQSSTVPNTAPGKALGDYLAPEHLCPLVSVRRPLSPLKIAAYFSRLLPLIAASPHQNWFEHFSYFCRYDSRLNRPNFFEKLSSFS
jgi:hypothetical protein